MEKNNERTPHPLFDALLEDLRQRSGAAVKINDATLCRALDVLPSQLSKMRKSHQPISDTVRVRVMRVFGWPIKRLDELAPPAPAGEGTVQ